MTTLLHIDASPRGDYSVSRLVSAAGTVAWKDKNPGGSVVTRDLSTTEGLSFVDLNWIIGAFSPPDQHSDEQKQALAISDTLVSELLSADTIIIGTPMYNFAIPAALKAWIDHVVRAGKTVKFAPDSLPEGLATGKKAIIVIASGGKYLEGTPLAVYNYEIPYLRHILGFIGITDVTFVQAGGTSALLSGATTIDELVTPYVEEIKPLV